MLQRCETVKITVEKVTVLPAGTQMGGTAPVVRAAKSSEFGKKSRKHLGWTHLEQVQH